MKRVSQRGKRKEKLGKPLRVELRHLGPIRMHILSGVKPGEIFMKLLVQEEEWRKWPLGGALMPLTEEEGGDASAACFTDRMEG